MPCVSCVCQLCDCAMLLATGCLCRRNNPASLQHCKIFTPSLNTHPHNLTPSHPHSHTPSYPHSTHILTQLTHKAASQWAHPHTVTPSLNSHPYSTHTQSCIAMGTPSHCHTLTQLTPSHTHSCIAMITVRRRLCRSW